MTNHLLEINGLNIQLKKPAGNIELVSDLSLSIGHKEIVGLVGESGSGKTLTALSILRLHNSPQINITGGKIIFNGIDLLQEPARSMQKIAGNKIAMIFQDPMTSLNPLIKIEKQLDEIITQHNPLPPRERREKILNILTKIGFPDPEKRIKQYPHQLSGGLQQRVMIAMSLLNNPQLLIADEPTTALDVTTQSQILQLLLDIREQFNLSILFISHDLLLINKLTDRTYVMYAGEIIESGPTKKLFNKPAHHYTKGLLDALPRLSDNKTIKPIPGGVPEPGKISKGCKFYERCDSAKEKCRTETPIVKKSGDKAYYKCHYPLSYSS